MTTSVCIPYRPGPGREAPFKRVMAHWAAESSFPVIVADSDPSAPFSVARARNAAVRQATTDVVILADADTLAHPLVVHQAVASVLTARPVDSPLVVWPFTQIHYLDASDIKCDNPWLATPKARYNLSVGGIMVMRRAAYWTLGGFDERFARGWGFEDRAFQLVAEALGSTFHLPGLAVSWDHPAPRDLSRANPNRLHCDRYEEIAGDRAALTKMIEHNQLSLETT